jgi:hypothetical protein
VQRTIFEQNAKTFVQKEFQFAYTQVVNRTYKFDVKHPSIELLLIGRELSATTIDSLQKRLPLYQLDSTRLMIRQGLDAKQEIDLAQIKASILEDVFSEQKAVDTVQKTVNKLQMPLPDLKAELKSLYPGMKEFTLSQTVMQSLDSLRIDTVTLFVARFSRSFPAREKTKLRNWLKERVKTDSLKLVVE